VPLSEPAGHSLSGWWLTWWFLILAALGFLGFSTFWLQWRIRRLFNRNLALERQVEDNARTLEEVNRALEEASLVDPLTGLHNRRFLEHSLTTDAQQSRRAYQDMLAAGRDPAAGKEDILLYLLDLDYFKQVNDTWGLPAGDAVLLQLGRALKDITRKTDFRVRWGGGTFLVVARRARRSGAPTVARNLLAAVRDLTFNLPGGEQIRKRISIGFTALPLLPHSPETGSWQKGVEIAEACLAAAKRSGRDRYVGALLKADADASLLEKLDGWDLGWARGRGLVDVVCSEPGFVWPNSNGGPGPR
jgi:diguanylate cyclase (GGDEF)-like protein